MFKIGCRFRRAVLKLFYVPMAHYSLPQGILAYEMSKLVTLQDNYPKVKHNFL